MMRVFLALLITCGFLVAETKPNAASGPGFFVTVERVARMAFANGDTVYSISYSYEFSNLSEVHIDHLGTVPAKAQWRYLTAAKELAFRRTPRTAPIVTVPLQETVAVAARPPSIDIPREEEFPKAHIDVRWSTPQNLQETLNTRLAKCCRYFSREENGNTRMSTTFTPIPLSGFPKGVIAKAAYLLTFPSETSATPKQVRVSTIVLEGRTHSEEWRPTEDSRFYTQAQEFVQRLIEQAR